MRLHRCLPVLALLLILPAGADNGPADKAQAQADVKKGQAHTSCCAAEKKVKCPKAKAAAASSKKCAAKMAPAAATAKPGAGGAANMVVTRDPETGELRNATAAERENLLGRRPLAQDRDLEIVTLPDGGVLVKARPEDANYTVATRKADGSLSYSCAHKEEAARQAVSPTPAPKREEH